MAKYRLQKKKNGLYVVSAEVREGNRLVIREHATAENREELAKVVTQLADTVNGRRQARKDGGVDSGLTGSAE